MTVEFALFLSPEGIALAHRQPKGHWALIAEARLDGDDLNAAMAGLKSAAAARGGADASVLLVLPDDQILYTSFMAPADDAALVVDRITEGLEGMTPYAVADLSYDWRAVEVDRVKVAVVAKETLGEATEFAAAHGFTSAGFTAMPPAERFPGMPLFGEAREGWGLEGAGMAFGADDWVAPEDQVAASEAEVEPAPAAETAGEDTATAEAPEAAGTAEVAPESIPGAEPEGPATAADVPAEVPPGDETPAPVMATPSVAAPISAPAPVADPAPIAEPAPIADTATADSVPPTTDSTDDGPLTAIADPTLDQPITPLTPEEETPSARDDSAAAGTGRTDGPADAPAAPTDSGESVPPPMAGVTRGRVAGAAARPITADKLGDTPPRPEGAPRFSAAAPTADLPPSDESTEAPAFGFSARRGKAGRPETAGGEIVSTRRSRLGFGATADDQDGPILHPDAAAPVTAPRPPEPAAPARPGGKLAAQLARVRDASKGRPQTGAPETAPDSAQEAAMLAPAARNAAPDPDRAASSPGFGFSRRRSGATGPLPSAQGTATAENAFSSGLLARKPAEQAGPSFRTGLILTVILLILLAMIAIWSALFLPDSPIARLFSGGGDRDSAALSGDPLDAPPPPAAVTAPPAIGALDLGTSDAPETPETPAPTVAAPIETPQPPAEEPPVEVAALTTDTADGATEAPALAPAPLPDIDADIDLPPLPPLPEEMLPTLEETERIYAEDTIWVRPPDRPVIAPLSGVNDLYIASIDPEVPSVDAIALADPRIEPGELLRRVPPPPPFGTDLDRDTRGLIQPTPEGVLTPEGAFVIQGRPAVLSQPRPREISAPAEAAPAIDVEDAILGTFTPRPRPDDLDETRERQVLGGFSATELAGLRPDPRPLSAQEAAARASLFPQAGADAPTETAATEAAEGAAPVPVVSGSALAIAASRVPPTRPDNIAAIVAAAVEAPAAAPPVATEDIARGPSIPSSADVTRAATERNAIRLRDINLIGVTGTPNDRRALVRLPSGRFVRVGVGDRLDGGRVAAIGEASLQYVRNGRNVTLEIPG